MKMHQIRTSDFNGKAKDFVIRIRKERYVRGIRKISVIRKILVRLKTVKSERE